MTNRSAGDRLAGLENCELREAPPLQLDGQALSRVLAPHGPDALADAVSALREAGLAALVVGGGNRLGIGNPASRADVLLSTERLSGVYEFDADEGVAHLGAGTTLERARAAALEAGWELPLDAPGSGATLGGVLSAAATGPRALGYRQPRDVALGLDVVLGSGDLTRCGGRVVKNVTGYDLAKLYIGSRGTLCVIVAAWIRLVPPPQRVALLEVTPPDPAAGCRAGIQASRCTSARACVVSFEGSAQPRVLVELAGDEATVVRDADDLESSLGARSVDVAELDAVRARSLGERSLGVRLPLLPSRFEATVERLVARPCSLLAYPGLGYAHVGFDLPDDAQAETDSVVAAAAPWFALLDELSQDVRGGYLVERAPVSLKRGRDVFGDPGASLPVLHALKQRFDPDGVLAPGRSAGRI
jgi:glycolate oxidase FAD binding subunit